MARRYLDRKTKDRYKKLTRVDDDPKFVTEKGPKIIEFDEAVKAPRSLYLKDDEAFHVDDDDVLTLRIMELVNSARETREYIEESNEHIAQQEMRIRALSEEKKLFDKQLKALEETDKTEKIQ